MRRRRGGVVLVRRGGFAVAELRQRKEPEREPAWLAEFPDAWRRDRAVVEDWVELWEQPGPCEHLDAGGWSGWAKWTAYCRLKAAIVEWGQERNIDYHSLLRAGILPSRPLSFRDEVARPPGRS
jgi:hypothetical protein